jgi:hypothetical protein
MKADGPPLPIIQIKQEIHDLELNRESPKYVLVAGHLTFQWKSAELPGFSLSHLDFLNNTEPVEQAVEESTIEGGFSTVTVSFRGRFECHNNFSAYPFNRPRIPVIFKKPTGNYALQAHSLSRTVLQEMDQLPQSDSYSIVDRKFVEGDFYKGHGHHGSHGTISTGDIRALGLYLDVEHKPLRTLILVLLPLLTIWGVSYSSQWWKEESAASRGVMASLFAATAVAIASTNLAPNVSCPTAVILAFCCYYISLMVLIILTVMAFREKMRSHPDEFRKVRMIGRVIGPVMLIVSLIFLSLWVMANRHPRYFEWLGNPVVIPEMGKPVSAEDKMAMMPGKESTTLLNCSGCSEGTSASTNQ